MNPFLLNLERFSTKAFIYQTFANLQEANQTGYFIDNAFPKYRKGSSFILNADATMKFNSKRILFRHFSNEPYGALGNFGKHISQIYYNAIRIGQNIYLLQLIFVVNGTTQNNQMNFYRNNYLKNFTLRDYKYLELNSQTLLNGIKKGIEIPFNRNLLSEKDIEIECRKFLKKEIKPFYNNFTLFKPIKVFEYDQIHDSSSFWKIFYKNSDQFMAFQSEDSKISFYEKIDDREMNVLLIQNSEGKNLDFLFYSINPLLFLIHLRSVSKMFFESLDIYNAIKFKKIKSEFLVNNSDDLNILRSYKHIITESFRIIKKNPNILKQTQKFKWNSPKSDQFELNEYLIEFIEKYFKEALPSHKIISEIIENYYVRKLNKKIISLTIVTVIIGIFGLLLGTPIWSTICTIIAYFA